MALAAANSKGFKSRNAVRREKKRQRHQQQDAGAAAPAVATSEPAEPSPTTDSQQSNSILESLEFDESDPVFLEYQKIFSAFTNEEAEENRVQEERGQIYFADEDDNIDEEQEQEQHKTQLSRARLRKEHRMSVAQLKQLVAKPDLVEWHDVASPDPLLLIFLKSAKGSVPVPEHWSAKRGYLSQKRGLEKLPFELPHFIRSTGILEMRSSAHEHEAQQNLRAQMRERVRPRMGKLDIDYQKLHDAFFRFQTKPHLTRYGDVYTEGREHQADVRDRAPGDLSPELIEALSIPPGAPPPYLINMQRYGPPPSYPGLRIPGINAPIPPGAQWGYHPGGWGKPPVDEYNRPLYGDVFGVAQQQQQEDEKQRQVHHEPVQRTLWAEFDPTLEVDDDDEDEEEEDEEEEAEDEQGDEEGAGEEMANDYSHGGESPEGTQTPALTGTAVPEHIELRRQAEAEEDDTGKSYYQVLPEQARRVQGFMGSQHGYDLSAAGVNAPVLGEERERKRKPGEDVSVSINPDDLDTLSKDELASRYDDERRRAANKHWDNDLSDMVAEQAAAASRKRQKQTRAPKEKFRF